uniref:Uncharacterized protein n=1 Tax=Setaria italica TaxID=4555 RepID=K4ANP5_SETIT
MANWLYSGTASYWHLNLIHNFRRYQNVIYVVPKKTSSALDSHSHPSPGRTSHPHRCIPGSERETTAPGKKLGVLDIHAWGIRLHI